jgi:uncharacterized membrane protein YidH (DUF202 family)
MSMRTAALSGAAVGGLLLLVAWAFDLPLEHVTVLAPLIVVVGGLVAGLVVLWSRVAWESLRRQRRPWLIVSVGVAAVGVIVALTLLGVELPRE